VRVTIEVYNLVDRLPVAQKREGRDERAGAHAGDRIELGLCERVLSRHLQPAF